MASNLRVYSTLTKTKEPFVTVEPGKVGMYLCGPTVYKPAHIGHMVGPVIFDAIKRYLTYRGYRVTWVVNITDVDDKLILQAAEEKTTVEAVARRCTENYLGILRDMGVDGVDHFPKATDHIKEILDLSKTLIDKGFAYAADGNVWFDVSKDADYGKLSNRSVEEQAAGGRDVEGRGKRNAADFALWKAAKAGEISWPSPWGAGRPGWHIECSAMAKKLLGDTFDIHGGGMDLMFPHHENEIAQSECATGKPLARYWMHNGLTRVRTKVGADWKVEKVSKSLGNAIGARELIDENGPEVMRYFLLSTHYRSPIEFTEKSLSDAKKGYDSITRALQRADTEAGANGDDTGLKSKLDALQVELEAAMDDDFNTAGAIAALHGMATELNKAAPGAALKAAAGRVREVGKTTLGLFQFAPKADNAGGDELAGKLMELLIDLRANARKEKNFAVADQIRKGLDAAGVVLEDKPEKTLWRRK